MEALMKIHRFSLFLFVVVALLVGVQQAAAQGGTGKGRLQGAVLDEEGNPIANAKVLLELQARETAERVEMTDNKGEWAMLNLGPSSRRA